MDPTAPQVLAEQSVLSLQISSESGQCDPQSELAPKVELSAGGRRADRAAKRFESDREVPEEACFRLAALHTGRVGRL
jgi:hypothetical protein